jgi:hypothetical protein
MMKAFFIDYSGEPSRLLRVHLRMVGPWIGMGGYGDLDRLLARNLQYEEYGLHLGNFVRTLKKIK